jgi:enamine deaminase RidA (YjgF/YER057c/UK114 family)
MGLEHLNPSGVHPPAGRYSHGVRVGSGDELLFVAGQVGARPDGAMAEGFEEQVRQSFANLYAVLAAAGMSMTDVAQINYYLLRTEDMDRLRKIRDEYLPNPPPASTALIVAALAKPEWLFELDAVAARQAQGGM